MKKLLISILSIFIIFTFISCAAVTSSNDFPKNIRESFVKVEKFIRIKSCINDAGKELCKYDYGMATGSGVVVDQNNDGNYILTAAHVCDGSKYAPPDKSVKEILVTMQILDLKLKRFDAEIVNMDHEIDACMMYVVGMKEKAMNVAKYDPEPGDKAYNVAAPVGIMYENVVPLIDGYYMGIRGKSSLYSIPATGGSSGSPVFNEGGNLIGMIHSVNRYFPVISVSLRTDDLKKFIWESVKKAESK